jgi:acetyltransferase-like isoleucine patch superfamily enzyme
MYESVIKFIRKNLKDREVCFWGADEGLESQLKLDGIHVSMILSYATLNKIERKNAQYYVVVPNLPWDSGRESILNNLGYNSLDFVFINHKPTTVQGDYTSKPYVDECGNIISGLVRGKIFLKGFSSIIRIESPIKLNNSLTVGSFCDIYVGEHCNIDCNIRCDKNSRLCISNKSSIARGNINVYERGVLEVGKSVTILDGIRIAVTMDGFIKIGDDCLFSFNVFITTSDGHAIFDVNTRKRLNPPKNMLEIGNHVWLGHSVTVVGSSTIGSGSIVGTKTLLKGNYPNNCIIVGIPSRIIRKDVAWSRSNAAMDISQCPAEYVNKTQGED